MKTRPSCSCSGKEYDVVFACSGAADVGAISDLAARRLSREKTASMLCTAAVGAGFGDILEKVRLARKILVIDGCKEDCARKVLEGAGFSVNHALRLETLGMEKGKTPVGDAVVERAAAQASELLLVRTKV